MDRVLKGLPPNPALEVVSAECFYCPVRKLESDPLGYYYCDRIECKNNNVGK